MRRFPVLSCLLATSAAFLSGCESGGLAFHYYDDDRPSRTYVHVEHGHVCGPACAHYWSGDRYVVIRDHVHGPGCGHVLLEGRWVVRRVHGPTHVHVERPPVVHVTPPPPAVRVHEGPRKIVAVEHVHGPRCGCAYDRRGSKWVIVGHDHVHGPGCGHVYIEGRWSVRY
jgi:hypothetical protein